MTLFTWLGVAACGGAGACARFLVDALISARLGRELPYGTLIVNLSGAFVLGLLAGATVSSNVSLLVGTATVGAYTTFSTWMPVTVIARRTCEVETVVPTPPTATLVIGLPIARCVLTLVPVIGRDIAELSVAICPAP